MSEVGGRKSLLDFIMVHRENRNRTLDVNVLRGAGGGISDHNLVVTETKCLRRWIVRLVMM